MVEGFPVIVFSNGLLIVVDVHSEKRAIFNGFHTEPQWCVEQWLLKPNIRSCSQYISLQNICRNGFEMRVGARYSKVDPIQGVACLL